MHFGFRLKFLPRAISPAATASIVWKGLAGVPIPMRGEFYRQAFSGVGTHRTRVHPNFTEWAGFVEDEWRVLPQLTINLGARYDLQGMPSPTIKNTSPALAAAGLDTSFVPTDKNNLAPRLGVAWMPRPGNNRFLVRGSYGIFYGITPLIMTARAFFQNGITAQTERLNAGTPQAALVPAYPANLCGLPASVLPPSCLPPVATSNPTLVFFSPRYVEPYTQQGNFGIEVEPQKNLSFSLNYLWV